MIETLLSYDIYEWLALAAGLAYAFFSVLNKPICWVFGIISCACIFYKDFYDYGLYFDGGLQAVYVLMGFIGLYNWYRHKEGVKLPITTLPWLSHVNGILLSSLLSLILAFCVKLFYNPNFAILDAFTSMFSIWATWLLVNRIYGNWYYWLIINAIYVGLYYQSGGTLVALLYILYFITAISGLLLWKRIKSGTTSENTI